MQKIHSTFIADSNVLLLMDIVNPHVNIIAANANDWGVVIYSLITFYPPNFILQLCCFFLIPASPFLCHIAQKPAAPTGSRNEFTFSIPLRLDASEDMPNSRIPYWPMRDISHIEILLKHSNVP